MNIDFSEIKNSHEFENFVMHYLEVLGLTITVKPAIGQDGGRDIICEEPTSFNTSGYRWLVSCKHWSRTIGVKNDEANANKLIQHNCHGFMFFCSTAFSEAFVTSVKDVCTNSNSQAQFFNSYEINRNLISDIKFYPLIQQYFPNSHNNLVIFLKKEVDCCPNGASPQNSVYIVYSKNNVTQQVEGRLVGECCIDFFDPRDPDNFQGNSITLLKQGQR